MDGWIEMDVWADTWADAWADIQVELDGKFFGLIDIRNKCFWEEEQRWGSVSKLINMLGSLEGLPSLSLYLENGKVKHYEKEKHWNTRLN